MPIWAVADGAAVPYLESNKAFDVVLHANPDDLPNRSELQPGSPCVVIAITDFARAAAAKKRGFPVVVVDALYWMWRSDPMDIRAVDAYLCLAFPGVADRIAKVRPPCSTLKEIPQICERQSGTSAGERHGLILNLGGGTTPFGFSYDYAAALVMVVQNALRGIDVGNLLVTCSDAARQQLEARGIRGEIVSLSLDEMLDELRSRLALITLPGLSIMWEATMTQIPTLVVPGISYSQHQLVREYVRYFQGMLFFTWDDLSGYGLLPPGMDEDAGVRAATIMADRFARDGGGILRLTRWLSSGLLQRPKAPTLRIDHPWGGFRWCREGGRRDASPCVPLNLGSTFMYVAVSGQAGTGKSTLVPLVANELGLVAILEEPAYLPAYIAWLEERGTLYEAQQQFLQRAFRLQQGVLSEGGIQERTIYENYEVAVRYYYAQRMLTNHEFDSLTSAYVDMCSQVRTPDLLVHLTASVEALIERRARRGKLHDLSITPSEIRELETYYQAMLMTWNRGPVCSIDTSSLSVEASVSSIADKVRDLMA